MTGLQKRRLTACPFSSPLTNQHELGRAADARGTAQPAFMNVPIGRRVVMAALGRQPQRRAEQPARCMWTPRIARQAWLAGGAAVGAVGQGRAEGEYSSTFSCHVACLDVLVFNISKTIKKQSTEDAESHPLLSSNVSEPDSCRAL